MRRTTFWRLADLLPLLAMTGGGGAAHGQAVIHPLTPVIVGHSVGGVSVDLTGNVYVADFGDEVWKITPEGERSVFARGFYGASGNAIDRDGSLLQASCYAGSLARIDRNGQVKTIVRDGLNCAVGVAVSPTSRDLFVGSCGGNAVLKIAPDGAVTPFATSKLFSCPNGLAFAPDGNLFVANYKDNRILKIGPGGAVPLFAKVSTGGLGHLCFRGPQFYVTASHANAIYKVRRDGSVSRIAGDGKRASFDGTREGSRLSSPNGIACDPWAPRLYINENLTPSETSLPRRAIVRRVDLAE